MYVYDLGGQCIKTLLLKIPKSGAENNLKAAKSFANFNLQNYALTTFKIKMGANSIVENNLFQVLSILIKLDT